MNDFSDSLKSLKSDRSLELAFIKTYIRNRLPPPTTSNETTKNNNNIKSCFDILNSATAVATSTNANSYKLFSLFKPIFITYGYLSIQKIVELLSFFHVNTSKQLEIFQNEVFSDQVVTAYRDDFLTILYQFKTQFDSCAEKSSEQAKLYYDLMSSLLAIYIDLGLIMQNSRTKHKKNICSTLFYLLDFSVDHICDALLQLTSLNEKNVELFSSVIRKLFLQCERLSMNNLSYLRLVLVYNNFYHISNEFIELYKGNFMAIRSPNTFVNYLKSNLKTYPSEFGELNGEEFIQNFMIKANAEINKCLVEYVAQKSNKQMSKSNRNEASLLGFTLITDERPTGFVSNSEIIITPLKKSGKSKASKPPLSVPVQNETQAILVEDLMENIDSGKLLALDTEVSKMIDSLVEEKHREACEQDNIQNNFDSPIPETPIKNFDLDLNTLKFSPNLLDKLSKSPIVMLHQLSKEEILASSPVAASRVSVKENDFDVLLVTPEQSPKLQDASFKLPSKKSNSSLNLECTSGSSTSPNPKKQIPSFSTKLNQRITKEKQKEVVVVVAATTEKRTRGRKPAAPKVVIKPITFTNRLDKYLKKETPPVTPVAPAAVVVIDVEEHAAAVTPVRKSTRKRAGSTNLQSQEQRDNNDLIVLDDETPPTPAKTRVSETEIESIDDTDVDETYTKDSSSNNKRKRVFTPKEESPVRRYNLRQSARLKK